MSLDILPLAVTMLVGPGIIADIVLITAPRPVRVSVAFVLGVAIATTAGVLVALALASLLGSGGLGHPSNKGSIGNVIQYVLVGLLAAAALRTYLRRDTIQTPRWMGALQNAQPRRAFETGALLIWVMPSDLIIMLTVGVNLAQNHDASVLAALPFVAATTLVAALPMVAYLLFRRRAQRLMPKVRDWMDTHSWLVSIIAYVVFILLIVS